MREILFRGKSASTGEWVYGSLIHVAMPSGNLCCILEQAVAKRMDYPYLDADLGVIDGQAIPVKPETVGQFAGCVDKTGKKVFEGDILRYLDCWGRESLSIIGYQYSGFVHRSPLELNIYTGDPLDDNEYGINTEYRDIIGNIYDNPELLEVTK